MHFNLRGHDPVPTRNTILLWVNNFRATGSALKRKSNDRPRSARTPENVAAVKASVQQSPRRSTFKRARALKLSERSLRRILHNDLQMHLYKRCWHKNSKKETPKLAEHCVWKFNSMSLMQQLCCSVMRRIFICVVQWISKTSDTGPKTALVSCRNAPYIVLVWLYGVLRQNLVYGVRTSLKKTTLQWP